MNLKWRSLILGLAVTLVSAQTDSALFSTEPICIAQTYHLKSAVLDQDRTLHVYLPPSYTSGTKSYPVLYLLDGGLNEDFVHIIGIASLAADYRNIREFIVVGIAGVDRYHDLVPPSSVEQDRKNLPTAGGAAKFRRFIEKEVMPFAQKHFRITGESVLMGESLAGLFVVETFLRQPELFTGYASVSPSLWWDGMSLAKSAQELLQKEGFPRSRRLFLTIADEGGDMRAGVDLLVAALKQHGSPDLDWDFAPLESETHGTIFHPAALMAVRQLFALKKENARHNRGG